MLPLLCPGELRPIGVLVAGVSPHLPFDERFRAFLDLVAGNLAARLQMGRRQSDAERAREASERIAEAERNAPTQAAEADHRKDRFLAMLAHELRTPIAALSNSLAVLDRIDRFDRSASSEPNASVLQDNCTRQVGKLARLVDDLLDVSRITRGKVELRRQPVDLAQVIRGAVETVRAANVSWVHELSIDLAPDRLWLDADPERLEQVVCNLLGNALKYTPAGGKISLSVVQEISDGLAWSVLRVKDNGRGIPSEMLSEIFNPFVQVSTALDRAEGGLGIGLTLVKELVETHRGNVIAHSAGIGQGSEFVVRLPLAPPPRESSPRLKPLQPGEAARRRVLIVEDQEDIRESFKTLIEDLGHEVEVAVDGLEGLKKVLTFRPDIALIDVGLPEIDGYEMARRVRADPRASKVRLVALTGYSGPQAEARSRAAGFERHLVKPIDLDKLALLLASPPGPQLQ